MLGAVVAPPDPVAATAVARRLRLPHRLVTVLEGEGMFNDATALVLYGAAVAAVVSGHVTAGGVSIRLLVALVAGVGVGLVAGLLTRWALAALHIPTAETTVTLAFEPLMESDPQGFRTKFRRMARDPFAFYRGTACLFYADVGGGGRYADFDRDWVHQDASRIWIQGDLHAENFGTYLDADGRLVFDVNDFDEAYLGHYTWDLARFCASLALLCWQKALPDEVIEDLVEALRACLRGPDRALPESARTTPSGP